MTKCAYAKCEYPAKEIKGWHQKDKYEGKKYHYTCLVLLKGEVARKKLNDK